MKNRYYIYIYLDPRKPGTYKYGELEFEFEPFYVGKGTNNRDIAKHDAKGMNYRLRCINEAGLTHIINRVYENLTEAESYDREAELIETIGRSYDKGPLINMIKKQKARKARKGKKTGNETMRNDAISQLLSIFN